VIPWKISPLIVDTTLCPSSFKGLGKRTAAMAEARATDADFARIRAGRFRVRCHRRRRYDKQTGEREAHAVYRHPCHSGHPKTKTSVPQALEDGRRIVP
jgi:hypothetical protein